MYMQKIIFYGYYLNMHMITIFKITLRRIFFSVYKYNFKIYIV